jgi:S1-C subfamily serine protease
MLKPIHFLLAVALLVLAACAGPGIRFATSAETAQATARQAQARAQATPTPTPSPSPSPSASPSPGTGTIPAPSPSPGSSGALAQFQAQLEAVAKSVLPSIVQIDTASGLGSGIIYDTAGDIVTNDHVVQGATSYTVKTSDGKTYTASLVGRYASNDLAVIKVANAGGLTPATFADSSKIQVGEVVLAIGSPFGLSDTVTEGIVSATGRTQSEGSNGVTLTDLVQTSALINPGNSGGALVDLNGQVIGIPTLSGSDSQGRQISAGIGFAIPSNQVTDAARQIVATGSVTHTNRPYLAITTKDDPASGVDVVTVVAGGPAAKAGIQAGWVITAVGGQSVADSSALSQALTAYSPGNQVSVTARLPDGSTRTVTVTLGERPVTP